jgi:hypothetical protein
MQVAVPTLPTTMLAGVDVVLSKPVAAADLRETIHRLTRRR